MKHTVLITDAGGRGAALAFAYAKSSQVEKILVVPGNDFISQNSSLFVLTFPDLQTTSIQEILELCNRHKVDLVDVAQDNAVAVAVVDALTKQRFNVFGPTQKAGELEWNKAWARSFMEKYQIPHPKYFVFSSPEQGITFLLSQPDQKWFIKAAGLAEGKGVLPAANNAQAIQQIKELIKFGTAGETYLLEQWLQEKDGSIGEEFSAFFLSDGKHVECIGYAQDHKRVGDGDTGENTGGMGCVSQPLVVTKSLKKEVEIIARRTIHGMAEEGRPYKGVLYIGGMVIEGKVYIIEYNARWGDPEAQVLVPGILNDFFDLGMKVAKGNLGNVSIQMDKKTRVSVALVAKGYPGNYTQAKGKKIFGIESAQKIPGVLLFGAGMKKIGKDYVVSGGRILHVVGEGKNVLEARKKAYQAIALISVEGNNLHYRRDIGYRDVERMKK